MPIAFAVTLLGAGMLPDQHPIAPAPPPPPREAAPPQPTATGDLVTIARMLRARTDLSWLMSPDDASLIRATPEQMDEARRISDLALVAQQRRLDRSPSFRQARRVLDQVVLAEAARKSLLDSIVVSDAEVAKMIRARPGRYDEFRLSHIFVASGTMSDGGERTDAEARVRALDVRDRLRKGAEFEALAKIYSDDPDTAAEGGTLSAMLGVYMADPFFRVASTLAVGADSEPVPGKTGYHILHLDERTRSDERTTRYLVEKDIRDERMPQIIDAAIKATKRASPAP